MMKSGSGVCSVGITGADNRKIMPADAFVWFIEWLPKGYGPGPDDRVICAFSAPPNGEWEQYGLSAGHRPPLIEAVVEVIERHMRQQSGV
jgi:hypothetical protein